jgi:aromatic amino acid aminotransferase I
MDTDGRVLRLDSLSKFISPGSRIGWVVGPWDFIAKYLLLQEVTAQFPSGISQSVFHGLMQHWGREGLNHHVKKVK